jgi:DNA sulfur modification protein DndC
MFLMQYPNPWNFNNKDLLTMYRSATADEECPLVIDTSTPSCGNSRFGCWTCTVVEKDKSMSAMIQNNTERQWMLPLLELRNELAEASSETRDFRRLNGKVSIFNGENVSGPYTQKTRAYWFSKVLQAQTWVRENGPEEVRNIDLISIDEIHEIRRIWVEDKNEHEDLLPQIFESETGETFPNRNFKDLFPLDAEDLSILKQESSSDLQYELLRELVSVEHNYRSRTRRTGLFESFDKAFDRSGWENPEEAINQMKMISLANFEASEGNLSEYNKILNEVSANNNPEKTTDASS